MQALSSLPLFYKLPSSDPSYWALIEEKLSTIIPDLQTLTNTINFFTEINYPKMSIFTKMDSLYFAIAEMRKQILGFCFFEDILPKLQKCCLEMPMLFKETQCKLKILPQGRNSDLRLSGLQVRCLLSHAFFNTLNTYLVQTKETNHKTSFGNISFYNLYVNPLKESVERMKCLFFYFHEVFNEDPKEDILFLRRVLPQSASPDWKNSETPIAHDVYISHIRKIEDSNAYMHLDFANRNLMIHKIIPSLTQEEILFSLRPALFVSLLVSETIADNEAIFMLGCRRYCTYKGYLRNFEFTGGYEERKNNKFISGIIAIDSVINFSDMQFDENFIERDLNKAYLGFTGIEKEIAEYRKNHESDLDLSKISSGNWGCGVFGGDYFLKFLQQIMAANEAKKILEYSTFGNKELCDKLRKIYYMILEAKLKVKDVYEIIIGFPRNEITSLEQYLNKHPLIRKKY